MCQGLEHALNGFFLGSIVCIDVEVHIVIAVFALAKEIKLRDAVAVDVDQAAGICVEGLLVPLDAAFVVVYQFQIFSICGGNVFLCTLLCFGR